MLSFILALLIGIVVGWHVKQPSWAVAVETWLKNKFHKT